MTVSSSKYLVKTYPVINKIQSKYTRKDKCIIFVYVSFGNFNEEGDLWKKAIFRQLSLSKYIRVF